MCGRGLILKCPYVGHLLGISIATSSFWSAANTPVGPTDLYKNTTVSLEKKNKTKQKQIPQRETSKITDVFF